MERKKLWFKAKRYGYGWYPSTWEGWAVVGVWIVLFAAGEALFLYGLNEASPNVELPAAFIAYTAAITCTLVWISGKRGEPARWRWGDDEKK